MKTKEEIEQLAEQLYPKPFNPDSILQLKGYREAYTKGYTQCQEDMADYIFEVARQFHRLGKYSGHTSDSHFSDIYEETINSLNKQD